MHFFHEISLITCIWQKLGLRLQVARQVNFGKTLISLKVAQTQQECYIFKRYIDPALLLYRPHAVQKEGIIFEVNGRQKTERRKKTFAIICQIMLYAKLNELIFLYTNSTDGVRIQKRISARILKALNKVHSIFNFYKKRFNLLSHCSINISKEAYLLWKKNRFSQAHFFHSQTNRYKF